MIRFVLVLLGLVKFSMCLVCLKCNSMDKNCGLTVARVYDVSSTMCSSRCYMRTNSSGIITRGCSDELSMDFNLKIPQNGCAILNNVYWCWCNGKDFCNDDSIRITLIDIRNYDDIY